MPLKQERMNIVVTGHVDHGKSTIIGRLLADTQSLPEGKLEQVKANCQRHGKPFEYAFLLDALKDEQSQGITIDTARIFFQSTLRYYIILDAPGHIEFLKNMITGASQAEAALLVIDADEGIQENSHRHGYLLAMLGIKQILILVNKMDKVGYEEKIFKAVKQTYERFLKQLDVEAVHYIPISGIQGDNIASQSQRMDWYKGPTVLDALDELKTKPLLTELPFRMFVQDVYKFTGQGDSRRIVAGTLESGTLSLGDEVLFYPSGKKSTIKTLEVFPTQKVSKVQAGMASGFTLSEQIYVKRGELAVLSNESKPAMTTRLRVSLFWLGKNPLVIGQEYLLKIGTSKVKVRVESIIKVVNASDLQEKNDVHQIERHEIAECILKTSRAMAFDTLNNHPLISRFVLVDAYEISGGGIIKEALSDSQSWVRDKVLLRNYKWETSQVPMAKRAERYNQKATLILITGARNVGKKMIAKGLESLLFEEGKIVYYLGIGSILYGLDADIKSKGDQHLYREEHLRRLAEVAHIMLDAGIILIVTAIELTQTDLDIIKTTVLRDSIQTIWVGEITTDIKANLFIDPHEPKGAEQVKTLLQEKGIVFRP